MRVRGFAQGLIVPSSANPMQPQFAPLVWTLAPMSYRPGKTGRREARAGGFAGCGVCASAATPRKNVTRWTPRGGVSRKGLISNELIEAERVGTVPKKKRETPVFVLHFRKARGIITIPMEWNGVGGSPWTDVLFHVIGQAAIIRHIALF